MTQFLIGRLSDIIVLVSIICAPVLYSFYIHHARDGTSIQQCSTCKALKLLTLTLLSPTNSNKGKWGKCAKSHYFIKAGSYGHEIAARAAMPKWRARGGQCIVVRETPGSYPHFWTPPFPRRLGFRVRVKEYSTSNIFETYESPKCHTGPLFEILLNVKWIYKIYYNDYLIILASLKHWHPLWWTCYWVLRKY